MPDIIKPDPIKKRIRELKDLENRIAYLKGCVTRAETFLKWMDKEVNKNDLHIAVSVVSDDEYIDRYGTEIPFDTETYQFIYPKIKSRISKWNYEIEKLYASID